MKQEVEEFLEAIWRADEAGDTSLAAIARLCPIEVDRGDLDFMVKRGLVELTGDRVNLTFEGRTEARSVVRRHRLAKSLFATVLDLDAETQEAIACEVEHTLLPEVEEAICTLLGHPAEGPDGKPIPPGRCCDTKRTVTSTVIVNLTSLAPGESGRIAYIRPKHHSRLHRLTAFGLVPGTVIRLHQRKPAFCIRYEGTELALERDVAEDIFVAKID